MANFEIDDLVWAKMKGYSMWPSRIATPPTDNKKTSSSKKPQHYVYFFGSKNYAWILEENIQHHSDELVKEAENKKKSAIFQSAINEILRESVMLDYQPKTPVKKPEPLPAAKVIKKPQSKTSQIAQKKLMAAKNFIRSDNIAILKRPLNLKRKADRQPISKSKKHRQQLDDNHTTRVGVIRPFVDELFNDLPPEYSDCGQESKPSKTKHVTPTQKRIGFLGLGMMGRGIVKNLLNSGHHVTVWNRTSEKSEEFIRAGALKGPTPADVIRSCDITFCCVADSHAVQSIIHEKNGVLDGLENCPRGERGYVEMTSLNEEKSREVADAIISKGGRYLEAQISGSRKLAQEGMLLILGSGDISLFNDCETCFHAMSRHAYYFSCEIGKGSKINLIMSLLSGTVYAAMAQSLALLDRMKLPQKEFLQIAAFLGLTNATIEEKGQAMLDKTFVPSNTPLKYVQKDIELVLDDFSEQHHVHVAAAANELYKHAKTLGYGEHDVSAIYYGARY